MLNEEFWGVDVDEESGLVYALSSMHLSVWLNIYQLLGRLGMLLLTHLMWRGVQPMGFVTNYCLHPSLQALVLAFLSRREALTPIGAVEVLGDFDLAAEPHV